MFYAVSLSPWKKQGIGPPEERAVLTITRWPEVPSAIRSTSACIELLQLSGKETSGKDLER